MLRSLGERHKYRVVNIIFVVTFERHQKADTETDKHVRVHAYLTRPDVCPLFRITPENAHFQKSTTLANRYIEAYRITQPSTQSDK